MAPISLPCAKSDCGWKTMEVELVDAKKLLVDHIRLEYVDAAPPRGGGGVTRCKSERMLIP